MYRHTYIQVDLDRLKTNVQNIIKGYPDYQYYIAVVKGNVYGHGSYAIRAILKGGVNYLAVSSLEEAIKIRKYSKKVPILCLEPIGIEYIDECVKNDLTLTIPSIDYFMKLMEYPIKKKIKVHLKIDTGMNRLGFKDKYEIKEVVDQINKSPFLELEGIFTHLITTGISDYVYDTQIQKFKELTSLIDLTKIKIVHLGRSLTLINHPRIDFCNGIRLGVIMYGFNNTPHYGTSLLERLRAFKAYLRVKRYNISPTTLECKAEVMPALSLYSEIIQIKKVKAGEYIGYGTATKAIKDMYIGVVPIGYADGFSRRNSGNYVAINGKKFSILGEVGMGMIQVEVDELTKVNDPVELLGPNVSIREVSIHNHTTSYETMCMLKNDLPRIYVENKKIIYIDE